MVGASRGRGEQRQSLVSPQHQNSIFSSEMEDKDDEEEEEQWAKWNFAGKGVKYINRALAISRARHHQQVDGQPQP